MKKILQQQAVTMGYVAGSAATPFKIGSQAWWLTAALFGLELAKTGANTTSTQDPYWRSITNLAINGGGNNYLSQGGPDMRSLYWGTRLRTLGLVQRVPDMVSGTVTIYHLLPWIPSPNPVNMQTNKLGLFNTSAPVRTDTDLSINLTWAANSVIAAGTNTIASTTQLRLTFAGAVLESGDATPVYKPEWNTVQYVPTQTYSGLGAISSVDTGFWYRASNLLFLNGSPNVDNRTNGFSASAISEIGVKTKDGRFPINMKVWDFVHLCQELGLSVADDNSDVSGATLAGGASVTSSAGMNAGVGRIDWCDYLKTSDPTNPNNPALADPVFGANLVSKNPGTLSIVATVDTATNTNLVIQHERYGKY